MYLWFWRFLTNYTVPFCCVFWSCGSMACLVVCLYHYGYHGQFWVIWSIMFANWSPIWLSSAIWNYHQVCAYKIFYLNVHCISIYIATFGAYKMWLTKKWKSDCWYQRRLSRRRKARCKQWRSKQRWHKLRGEGGSDDAKDRDGASARHLPSLLPSHVCPSLPEEFIACKDFWIFSLQNCWTLMFQNSNAMISNSLLLDFILVISNFYLMLRLWSIFCLPFSLTPLLQTFEKYFTL